MLRLTHGIFGARSGAYQEYVVGLSAYTSKVRYFILAPIFISIVLPNKVPANISYDQAGGLPSAIGCAYLGLYSPIPDGLGLTTPLGDNGRSKYDNTPLLIFGGATNVGQYGTSFQELYSTFVAKDCP